VNEDLDGRRIGRTIIRFALCFGAFVVIVAIALIAAGRPPSAVGVLLGLVPVGAFALYLRRRVRSVAFRIPRPTGISIMAATTSMPGVVLLFIGNLIGDAFIVIVCSAFGTGIVGTSGLTFTMLRSMSQR
jgi:hypothetical protein